MRATSRKEPRKTLQLVLTKSDAKLHYRPSGNDIDSPFQEVAEEIMRASAVNKTMRAWMALASRSRLL